ncbi:acyltransferase family protein [Pseudoduganella buxea]|uniref:Acyltransferase n=1 Tax=Pseudoduganella buxea TaxID=1949069 RepID=A0A6I3SRX0_9BURK|nr:acyltransferase [Pseudoduganella buxea]MTV51445.1 acyltransferase family protein [Pseudoduganella buxea]GGB89065.1 acyltransferase [Pseudoduganella buxea]
MKIEKIESGVGHPGDLKAVPRKKGFWALNWLRFILAIYIVLFHTLKNYPAIDGTWYEAALGLGNMATSLFFALSGFLLTYAYVVKKNGQRVDTRNFLIARFSTLYPLHIAGLLLSLVPVVYAIYNRGGMSVPIDVSGTATRMLDQGEFLLALAMNALLLNAWNPYYLSFNYPSWSLSALACYYLVFPVIAPGIYRMKSPIAAIVLLGVVFLLPGAIADALHRTDVFTDGLLHRNPIIRLPLFVAGMVLCVLFARSRNVGSALQVGSLVTVMVATVAIAVVLRHEGAHLHMIKNGLYYPSSLALIWLCVCIPPTSNRWLTYWGERLGAASLPLFLLHGPLFSLFRVCERYCCAVLASAEWNVGAIAALSRTIEQSVPVFPVYLVLLVIICIVVQERVVAPLQVTIRNYLSHRKGSDVEKKTELALREPVVPEANLPVAGSHNSTARL